jgi:ABC-type multidrug transport system fused ATPase/permease subunit
MRALFAEYLKYKTPLAWAVLCNVLASIFTLASIPALIPFLMLLLSAGEVGVGAQEPTVGLWYDISSFEQRAKWQLAQWMHEHGQFGAMWRVCLIIVTLFLLKNLFRYLSLYILAPVRTGLVRDFRQRILHKLVHLPMSFYSEERKGDLVARVTTDVMEIEWSIMGVMEAVVREPILIFGSIAFMLFVSPMLTAFVLLLIFFVGLVIGLVGKNLRKESAEAQTRLGSLIAILDETLGGVRAIKAFGAEKYQERRFETENLAYAHNLAKALRRRDLASPLSEFLGVGVVCVLLMFGSHLVFSGALSSEVFLVFLYAFFNVIEPSKSFTNAIYSIKKGMGALERVEEVLRSEDSIFDAQDALDLGSFQSEIRFEQVNFTHKGAAQATLTDISFQIEKGKMVALVGPSGAGKSTIADLLPRFFDIEAGAITIDQKPIRQIKLTDLRALFGIVGQEAILFNDSVRNNLTLGLEPTTDAQLIDCLKSANAYEFVQALPQGMDTLIGDRGMKLSGGQRQRLTIARALLRDPEVMILDEATSALDSESERLVQEAFDRVLRGRTSLVIAHRLSTVMHADQIIVLDAGKIVACGKHDDLFNHSPLYRRLVQLQTL